MPVSIKSVGKGKVSVSTPGGMKAKRTTPAKAARQKRLLYAVDHGWKPTGKNPAKYMPTDTPEEERAMAALEHAPAHHMIEQEMGMAGEEHLGNMGRMMLMMDELTRMREADEMMEDMPASHKMMSPAEHAKVMKGNSTHKMKGGY